MVLILRATWELGEGETKLTGKIGQDIVKEVVLKLGWFYWKKRELGRASMEAFSCELQRSR